MSVIVSVVTAFLARFGHLRRDKPTGADAADVRFT